MDKWYQGLSNDQKKTATKQYVLNRNRLFLVTQEKRLKVETETPIDLIDVVKDKFQPSWIAAGRRVLNEDKRKLLSDIQKVNELTLGDEKALSKDLIRSLADMKVVLKGTSSEGLTTSFSRSLSKSAGGTSDQSYFPRSWAQDNPDMSCKKGDEECFKSAINSLVIAGKLADREMFESFLEKTRGPLKPVCQNSETVGLAPGTPEFTAFQKKRDEFLKNVGSQNWKPKKSENDLSSWYSEPISQWTRGESKPNAKCVGHAISSDIASVVNKSSFATYSVNPNSTYAQIQVITREDLEKRDANGTINSNESAILQSLEDVPSINSKHAEFCNSSFYKVDDYMGAAYIDNSMNHVFKAFQRKPLCGFKVNAARNGHDVPLFTVDKFESMEFDTPSKHALDFDFFRQMIDTGNPPIVGINSDNREESGEWIHIKRRKTQGLDHFFNVVGYGEEIDPTTFCKVKYLKVRDTLGEKQIHYKIPADNLIEHLIGVYKVTSVKQTD